MGRSPILERDLFSLFDHAADAAYAVTDEGEICSWNAAAERIFGYGASEVLHRNIEEVLEARDALGTRALAGGLDAATRRRNDTVDGIENFDLEVRRRDGTRIWISVSTIVFETQRRRLFIRLAHDISRRRRREELFDPVMDIARQLVAITDDASDHAPVEPLSDQERHLSSTQAASPAGESFKPYPNVCGRVDCTAL